MQTERRNSIFFTVRVAKHWNRLFREVVEYQSVEILRTRLDTVLANLLKQGAEVGDLERSFQVCDAGN